MAKWVKVTQEGLGSWWVLGDSRIEVWPDRIHANGAWCAATGTRGFEVRIGMREIHSIKFDYSKKNPWQHCLGAAQKWARQYMKEENEG